MNNNISLSPASLTEALNYAEIIAKSTIIPKSYQGKPADILIAMQLGAELGLKPVQSLQNIATINGRPCIWGDAMLALVQATVVFENIEEYYDEGKKAAVCTVKRKNQTEHTVIFSEEDAKKAGLWGKAGPWVTYPKRMLQVRARGFALRDKFADVLGGLITAEEAQDYPVDVTPKQAQKKDSKVVPFNKPEQTDESDVAEQKIYLAKELMRLCQEAEINPKEFADEHNIKSDDIDSIKRGIELFTLSSEENTNIETVAN